MGAEDIPDSQGPVDASGEDIFIVAGKAGIRDLLGVADKTSPLVEVNEIPDLKGEVSQGDKELLAVDGSSQETDTDVLELDSLVDEGCIEVPENEHVLLAPGNKVLIIVIDVEVADTALVPLGTRKLLHKPTTLEIYLRNSPILEPENTEISALGHKNGADSDKFLADLLVFISENI